MDKIGKMLPYLLICAMAFYMLPLLGKDTGSFMLILLIAIPIICFIVSLFYGIKNGLNLIFVLIVGVIFIPTIFIYYNSSAWIYTIEYAIVALAGNMIGGFIVKRSKES
ncbi:MAG: Exosortase [Xylanivirga thermophila]|jgi:hypothetical protein|uniref:hypothetical protein n=1 Tax=Xylanivirga thermophila TaxID=2496273 RepID=UPI00101CC24C|nr:hypothetical protein [Xylanivirga thermophila]